MPFVHGFTVYHLLQRWRSRAGNLKYTESRTDCAYTGSGICGRSKRLKPSAKPANPCFSSGPCRKFPGYSPLFLRNAPFGRSHRSEIGRSKLRETIQRTRSILGVPSDYKIAIMPASDTGAFELAMWNMLGARGIDVFAWESFGNRWVTDITKHLRLDTSRVFRADYGRIANLSRADFENDFCSTGNWRRSGGDRLLSKAQEAQPVKQQCKY